jgi:O-antigen ligase
VTEIFEDSTGGKIQPVAVRPVNVWLERVLVGWLFVIVVCAPHSIAATQIAWSCGLLVWVARFALRPRPAAHRTPVDYALLGFFILTGISAFTSYDPDVSIGKLRAASLFTLVYLFAENVNSRRLLRALVIALVASCMVNVVFTLGERIVGRGVKVAGVSAESPLAKAVFIREGKPEATPVLDGDTILEVDGRKVRSPEDLVAALEREDATHAGSIARMQIYRVEWMPTLEVPRGRLLAGGTSATRLGVASWTHGRDWRAAGFYGHYVTYAEVLQLIASLTFGLFIALQRKRTWSGALLLLALAGMSCALLLTVTRASQGAFVLSAALIVVVGAKGWRTVLVVASCALPLVLAGAFLLQQKRQVGFYDEKDQSITWRETVWREGAHLLVSKPRHLLVGVGMDSIKRHWRAWGLFDNGRIPTGHMHSNLLELALERGLPALLMWLVLLMLYARVLWRLARRRSASVAGWLERGLALGALGGLLGFFTSGLVHYNWGDSEVVMIFYIIMGLSLAVERASREDESERVQQVVS